MPLLKIDADGARPLLHGPGELDHEIARSLAALPAVAPVLILIHGYRFSPYCAAADPHRHILSLTPQPGCRKAVSWPRHMGFGRDRADEGLCIAFGWEARGSIWRAWDSAARAGDALARLVRRVHALRQGPVDVLCHSLGARVALGAMVGLPPGSVGRAVLLAAAEYRATARAVLDCPAGSGAEVINVTSGENAPFDLMVEWLVRPPERGDRALGAGLGGRVPNWLDLPIDCDATRAVLADLGYRIPVPARRVCHWSAYLRPGLFALYSDLIRARHALPIAQLQCVLPVQATPSRRWLVPGPNVHPFSPWTRNLRT